jgi:hypothetical protein
MEELMTKAQLLEELRDAWAGWEAVLTETGQERMQQQLPSGWSVKDLSAHITRYARWYVLASEAHFKGESPPMDGSERMEIEQRNQHYYEQDRELPLDEVRASADETFHRLLEVVAAHDESFLIQPQTFEGTPEPVLIWQMLRGDVYDHIRDHTRQVREWLDQKQNKGKDQNKSESKA